MGFFLHSFIVHLFSFYKSLQSYLLLSCTAQSGSSSVYLSTNIPACTACTMLLNLGFSSGRRLATPILLLKVHASQSRTSLGTDSACKSLSSSSVSNRRLQSREKAVTAWMTSDKDLFSTHPSGRLSYLVSSV